MPGLARNMPPLADCHRFSSVLTRKGGTVTRLKPPFTQFKGNPYIQYLDDARSFAEITASELRQAGVNMNFAPVMDWVPEGVPDSIMAARVFKGDISTVSALGCQVIRSLQENGIMAVAKHFPGIGRTVLDSHLVLPVLDIDPELLKQTDLIPFQDAVGCKVAGMMLSHIFYPKLDSRWQASLSPIIARDLIRDEMGYEGLVMTDDLDMKAIESDMATCIKQVLLCCIDQVLVCHRGPAIDEAYQEILRLRKENDTLLENACASVGRVLSAKATYLNYTLPD